MLLKISITAWAVFVIIRAADLSRIWKYIHTASPVYVLLAFLAINAGQVVSALRMRYYFSNVGFKISKKNAILLYFAGNLFNLILPGAIGGDGYKAYLANKHGKLSVATAIRTMLSSRANGLLLLILFSLVIALFSPKLKTIPYIYPLLFLAAAGTITCYSIAARILLKEPVHTQIGASRYSFFIQLAVIITATLLLISNRVTIDTVDYVFLFMISSIISVMPISVGGIGLRELTFFKGAPFLGLDQELGVAICIIYFGINSLSSLIGLAFLHRMKHIGKS